MSRKMSRPLACRLDRTFVSIVCLVFAAFWGAAVAFGQTEEEPTPEPARITDLRFDPERPETGAHLRLMIKMTGTVRAEVRWSLNGEEVELADYDGLSGFVDFNKPISSGDKIEVAVTPFDFSQAPGDMASKEVVCGNAPPTLKLVKQELTGYNYHARVEATDPEKGPVTLSVEGPPGMRIDQKGNVTWNIGTQTSTGHFQVKVTAKDQEGATAILTYSIEIGRSRR